MEADKLDYAGGGGDEMDKISDKDRKLLDAFHKLHFHPDIDSVEDLERFMRKYGSIKKEPKEKEEVLEENDMDVRGRDQAYRTTATSNPHQYPRFSQFYGEGPKGEVTWETFKFEVEAVRTDNAFQEEQILTGIRRAVKGEAGDLIRRLGTTTSLDEVIKKLESTYGQIDSKETVLKKFYSCVQQGGETVTGYASRIEEFFAQACDLKALRRSDTEVLKQVLYQGLRKDIKQMAIYQSHTVTDYDLFKIELRKIEAEVNIDKDRKPCKPAVSKESTDQTEKTELSEVKSLLMQLNQRIQKLEEKADTTPKPVPVPRRPPYLGMNNRNADIRDRRESRTTRPLGATTFQPTCFNCKQKGHLARNCPKESTRRCYRCDKTDHVARYCPNW